MKRDHTATALVIHENRVLLLYHAKFKKWLPPGGHLEENETPQEAAIREVYEECGLAIELFSFEHLWIVEPHAKSLVRPYMSLLENISEKNGMHQHIDSIFLARIKHPKFSLKDGKFFLSNELENLETFPETKELIIKALADDKHFPSHLASFQV